MTLAHEGLRFEVFQEDLARTRWTSDRAIIEPIPEPGAIRLRIDRFGLTANNITYALYGRSFGYWNFFPASPEWGIIPVWGYADVVASDNADIAVGERLFGYLPMAQELIVRPDRVTPTAFIDVSSHRAGLPPTYNEYRRVKRDTRHAPPYEGLQMILKPLLTLSWLVADMISEESSQALRQVVITGASSRTALGIARALQDLRPDLAIVGLTSAATCPFVRARSVHATVLDYGAINHVERVKTTIVDIAGNHGVLQALHLRLAGHIQTSLRIGDTAQAGSAALDLADPQPVLFFAPDQIRKRRLEWGAALYQQRYEASWDRLSAWIDQWLMLEAVHGTDAIERVYHLIRQGHTRPDWAPICHLP